MTDTGQRPLVGMAWMLVAGLLFVGVNAVVKHAGQNLPAPEAAFLRYACGLAFLVPMLGQLRGLRLSRRVWILFACRGGVHTLGVVLWFFAMTRIPLAEVSAMGYLTPIIVTVGASLFLGERFRPVRGLAVLVAVCGTLLILRPGIRAVSDGHLAMIGTATLFAASYMVAKSLADKVSAAVMVTVLSITVTIGLSPFAIAVWEPPSLADVAWLALTAAFATGGHYAMTLALRAAPISVTQPVSFLQLLWATLLGALAFGEPADALTIAGGVLIAASVLGLSWYEARGRRRRERMAMGSDDPAALGKTRAPVGPDGVRGASEKANQSLPKPRRK